MRQLSLTNKNRISALNSLKASQPFTLEYKYGKDEFCVGTAIPQCTETLPS